MEMNIIGMWKLICSYPTYEEWKHKSIDEENFEKYSSYPTYEEWKLPKPAKDWLAETLGSYPTYEEWKPKYFFFPSSTSFSFLSYL